MIPTHTPDPDAQWWITIDVAAYLTVQVATVSSYRRRGQMPAPDQTVGRTHMWTPARIIAWNQQRPRPGIGGRTTDPVAYRLKTGRSLPVPTSAKAQRTSRRKRA